MMMGIMVGLYIPMNRYARNNDCYSQFWESASNLIEYHDYFDGEVLTTG